MARSTTRRGLLTTGLGGLLLGALPVGSRSSLRPVSAETAVTPDLVRFTPEIEPLVRLIEETPREQVIERIGERLRAGLSERQLVAAMFLAAVRSGNTHEVFVTHSAYQMSLDAAPPDRLLPLFWILYGRAGRHIGQTTAELEAKCLRPFRGSVPAPGQAVAELEAGLVGGDPARSEGALVSLIRSEGAHRVIDLLWNYGARSCADLYHIPIAVANSWRTLETIGSQHAEPVLRWLLLRNMHGPWDSHYRTNRERLAQRVPTLPSGWAGTRADEGFTLELLEAIREFKTEAACDLAASAVGTGRVQAGAVWDAVHLAAGELMMAKPNVGHPLHSNTCANAMHYGFRMHAAEETRLLILLQSVAWQSRARWRLDDLSKTDSQWKLRNLRIADLHEEPLPEGPGAGKAAVESILNSLGRETDTAARRLFTLARSGADLGAFQQAAERQVALKAGEIHDLKYPAALFEDCRLVSPQWRPHLLASSAYWLPGTERPDAPGVAQAREIMRTRE
jgi:hypothetical protein